MEKEGNDENKENINQPEIKNEKEIITESDSGFYEGDYINNVKEGNGRFKWANGKIYIGPFRNGNPNGNGILFVNNRYYEVNFENGEIKGKVVEI